MTVRMEIDGAVAVLTIDRPQALNALDVSALRALRTHLAEVRDREDLRAAVLTGAGARAFCAGATCRARALRQPPTPRPCSARRSSRRPRPVYPADGPDRSRVVEADRRRGERPLPRAGLEIALQCDLRVASAEATFGLPEASVGSIPAVSGLHRLLKAVPSAHAMQMALTGERIDADQAQRIGLVTELTAPGTLLERAVTLAGRIARNAPLAVQAIKKLSRQTPHLGEADAQQLTELYWGVLRDTGDRHEGRQAFVEKRPPRYLGR